ncbi:hypothetical protein [Algoriphagus pacificus]|uniref:Uncharacterized protein n=1 Tax=Algoriphagus pacificus TaxID=2811234 RepID=A0ABS3CLW5_9BACT|nr:hypothetical protein [Algoriphagus pacificus]MBN7818091.1 hypothetical protein [Algoriphagus pacificus]
MKKLKSLFLALVFLSGVSLATSINLQAEVCPDGKSGLCIYVNGSPKSCGNSINNKADCKNSSEEIGE